MKCIHMTVCPNTIVVLFIMTLIFILSAQWIRSLLNFRTESRVLNLRQDQTLSDEINHIAGSEDSESLTEAQLCSFYAEFYENIGEEELHNLDNYLDRE